MKTHETRISLYATIAVALGIFLFVGCSDNKTTAPVTTVPTVEGDITEIVVTGIAADDGGALDQFIDISALADGNDSLSVAKVAVDGGTVVREYDSLTAQWQVQLTRQRGDSGGPFYAQVSRTYRYQYRNKDGVPQARWLVGADTAYSMGFSIMEGDGECRTLRFSHRLTALNGEFEVTGVNTDTLTINGSYSRSGVDTLKTFQSRRMIEHQLTLQFSNVRCLRGNPVDFCNRVSGEVSGQYAATVTFMSGFAYGETNITRNMNIIMGEGRAIVAIGDKIFEGDLATGELTEDGN